MSNVQTNDTLSAVIPVVKKERIKSIDGLRGLACVFIGFFLA